MKAADLLVRQIERELENFLELVAKVPDDKLDWQPAPQLRSTLSQYQEVATILEYSWDVYEHRKMEWDEAKFDAYKANRARFTTREACEAELKRQTQRLIDFVRTISEDDLHAPVEMPWPGDFRLADCIHYHVWNLSYHQGQISAILLQLGIDPMGG
jgi:uncharacterized damage-inducible protein DinB